MTLATRSLLTGLALVAVLAVLSVLGVLAYTSHAARERSLAHLSDVRGIAVHLQKDRVALLRLRADTLAGDPSFVDYMAQSLIPNPAQDNAIDKTSIIDLLSQDRHGFDLAMVLDPDGRDVASSGLSLVRAKALQRDPLVKQVIATRKPANGLWVDDGRVLQVVVEPLLRAGALQGLLLTAQQLDGRFVNEVSSLARAGMGLIVSPGQTSEPPLTSDAAPWMATVFGKLRMPSGLPAAGRALQLEADGHTAWGWISPIRTKEGTAALVAFAQHSAVPPVTTVWPLLLGILVLTAIGFAVVAWHWRRVALPLQALGVIVERGAQGDHRLQARVDGSPGVRRLRDAVNQWFQHDEAVDAAGTRTRLHD
ncbi:MAG: hypothetical protein ACREPK_00840 [Rhodanobacteraceae bacterium]